MVSVLVLCSRFLKDVALLDREMQSLPTGTSRDHAIPDLTFCRNKD